jgi:hypothetical protein
MLYFDTLPKTITTDQNGTYIILTNLLTRAKLLDELQNNPMLFYTYSIQDGDTPEIVADKYYNDPFAFWIVLYSNQILDPIWNWPLTYLEFLQYIDSKYATESADADMTPFEYTNTTVKSYQKITRTTDNLSQIENVEYVTLTQSDYNSLTPSTETYTLPSGSTCIVSIEKTYTTIYDYEYNLNETRRDIKLLNSTYLRQMEKTFTQVMGS